MRLSVEASPRNIRLWQSWIERQLTQYWILKERKNYNLFSKTGSGYTVMQSCLSVNKANTKSSLFFIVKQCFFLKYALVLKIVYKIQIMGFVDMEQSLQYQIFKREEKLQFAIQSRQSIYSHVKSSFSINNHVFSSVELAYRLQNSSTV